MFFEFLPPACDFMDTRHTPLVSRSVLWPFILLTTLFAWWGLANNMTDTLLPAFKRIMSFNDGTTAWIQVVCYALGYGCFDFLVPVCS